MEIRRCSAATMFRPNALRNQMTVAHCFARRSDGSAARAPFRTLDAVVLASNRRPTYRLEHSAMKFVVPRSLPTRDRQHEVDAGPSHILPVRISGSYRPALRYVRRGAARRTVRAEDAEFQFVLGGHARRSAIEITRWAVPEASCRRNASPRAVSVMRIVSAKTCPSRRCSIRIEEIDVERKHHAGTNASPIVLIAV